MITCAVETWRGAWREMEPLWPEHWREVAIDHDEVPLAPDVAAYQALEDAGLLHVVVVRSSGAVIGYHLSFVKPHFHYRTTLHAFVDIYFVKPEFRAGTGAGLALFAEANRSLRARGVRKIITATKLQTSLVTGKSLNIGPLLRRLGYRKTEDSWTLCFKD